MMHFFKAWTSALGRKANRPAAARRPPQLELLENRVVLSPGHGLAKGLLDAQPPRTGNPHAEVRVVGNPHQDASEDAPPASEGADASGPAKAKASKPTTIESSQPATIESSDQPDAAPSSPKPATRGHQAAGEQSEAAPALSPLTTKQSPGRSAAEEQGPAGENNDASPALSPSATKHSRGSSAVEEKGVGQEASAQAQAVTESQTSPAEVSSAGTNGNGRRTPQALAVAENASGNSATSEEAAVPEETAPVAGQDQDEPGQQVAPASAAPAAGRTTPPQATPPVDTSASSTIRPAAVVPSFTAPLPVPLPPAAVAVQAMAGGESATAPLTASAVAVDLVLGAGPGSAVEGVRIVPLGGGGLPPGVADDGEVPAAEEALAPQGADLQTPVLPVEAFERAADWQQVRDQTRAALDRLLSLAESAGPWSLLAGGTLLAVAAEVVRRRAARARRPAPGGWPEVVAPDGLG
jgi:hypothetical protein